MIVVRFNGDTFNLFDEITLNTSLDNITGAFSLKTTLNNNLPFGLDDFIEIVVDGEILLSGFIEKASGSISNTSVDVNYSGRDALGDLVDDSVPDVVKVNQKAIGLVNLCQKTLDALKIKSKVINLAGDIDSFTSKEIEAIGFGGNAGGFLQGFCRKRGVFLITDGLGNLVIFTPPSSIQGDEKITENDMLDRSFDFDNTKRFNVVRVGSQDNNASDDDASTSDGVRRTQQATDEDIRESRFKEIIGEETMNNRELLRRAEEEINITRARGFTFSFSVPSHIFRKGNLIRVEDRLSGVNGVFLIKSIDFSQNGDTGNTSRLTICYPESYSAQGKRVTKRKSVLGKGIVKDPDLLVPQREISILEKISGRRFTTF